MLLKKAELEAVKSGTQAVIFRRWRRPTVKAGGTLKTPIGVIGIDSIETVRQADISDTDARRAGHASRTALLATMARHEGSYYRIVVHYAGADPRIALREDDALSEGDFEGLQKRLRRLDAASKTGPWTFDMMRLIERHPKTAARVLAAESGRARDWLKLNVRKLKNLGLTISHHPGYELSPRGKAVLRRLEAAAHDW